MLCCGAAGVLPAGPDVGKRAGGGGRKLGRLVLNTRVDVVCVCVCCGAAGVLPAGPDVGGRA